MALKKKARPQFAPDEIAVCWMGFSTDRDGETLIVRKGERLRGDHPAVVACPSWFVRDGTPRREWPSVASLTVERDAKREAAGGWSAADKRASRLMTTKYRALRDVAIVIDGVTHTVRKDDVVAPTHPARTVAPDAWKAVLVERE